MAAASSRRKILVALDGSSQSFDALLWAITDLLHASDHVVVLHVQPSAQILPGLADEFSAEDLTFVRKNQDELSRSLVHRAKTICDEHHLCSETKIEVGDPRTVICEVVDKIHPSFLIVGSHGYGAVKRAFLGSVSDYCVHNAHCPVFIVKRR